MKKALKIALFSVLGLLVVAGVLVWMEFGPLLKGAMSCEKLDEGMYYMEYAGDDGFDELMKRGGCANINVLANYITDFLSKGHFKTAEIDSPLMPVGCSTLTVSTPDGGVMMARNFDFPYGTAMILHTTPDDGYESITTFSTDFFGFGENYKPEGFQNPTSAVQYLLKNAANVKEALELLRGIDMNSDPGSAYHLSMADATGRSVAVEYVDNKMVVTDSPFVTNHYLCKDKFEVGLHEGDHRHEKLMEQYDKTGGVMNEEHLTKAIASVTQLPEKGAIVGGTLWTMVMDLKHPSVTYYSRRHFDKPLHFTLSRTN